MTKLIVQEISPRILFEKQEKNEILAYLTHVVIANGGEGMILQQRGRNEKRRNGEMAKRQNGEKEKRRKGYNHKKRNNIILN